MLAAFNMGVGMAVVANPSYVPAIQQHLAMHNCRSYKIGEIVAGSGAVHLDGSLRP